MKQVKVRSQDHLVLVKQNMMLDGMLFLVETVWTINLKKRLTIKNLFSIIVLKQARNNMQVKVEQMQKGTCGCGRSPTGNCCGWHSLTQEQFEQRKELYETGKVNLAGKEIK
jgi:CDGSH-type Zn-finger protein